MLSLYLNEQVTYEKRKSTTNDYNNPEYESLVIIDTNKQASNRYVRNLDGEVKTATNVYFVLSEVFVGDIIDGNIVLTVEPDKMLDGTLIGYEVYT